MGKETTKVTRKAAAKDDDAKKPARRQKKTTTGPKRGLSAYMFFSQDNREVVKKENPSASFGKFIYIYPIFYTFIYLFIYKKAKLVNFLVKSGRK